MRSLPFRRGLIALGVAVLASVGLASVGSPATANPIICTTVNDVWNNAPGTDQAAVAYPTIAWNNVNCDFRVDESWSNPAVTLLQWTLNTCYGPNAIYQNNHRYVTRQLATDGKYGNNTRGAVQEFQRWYNANNGLTEPDLATDGYAGPTTRSKMRWVTNGLYGARCTTVVKNPPITVTAPAGVRHTPTFGPYPCGTRAAITVRLHGHDVFLDRCGNGTRARMENAPAGAVVSLDRSNFQSPTSCGGDCYLTSAEIGVRSENPRYYFRDDSYRTGTNTVQTPYINATRYYTRACLLLNGYYQCSNQWYADVEG